MKKRITSLIKEMSEGVYEKEHILSLALLSSIAGESIFLLGPRVQLKVWWHVD